MSQRELANWVKEQLMANDVDALSLNKEKVKQLIRLTTDGNVVLESRSMTSRLQVGLYYVGIAYAKVAGLRLEDAATNKEISEKLGLPEGTVHPKVKELRDEHLIEPVKDGLHRINYARMNRILEEAIQAREGSRT